MKKILNLAAAGLLILVSGCSFFAPYKQTIYINGTPADATVIVNGKTVLVPAELQVPRNKNLTIIAYKNGFEPYKTTTGYSLNTIGILDAIGCWLVLLPGLGLLSPGAWELSESSFYYVLSPSKTNPAPVSK